MGGQNYCDTCWMLEDIKANVDDDVYFNMPIEPCDHEWEPTHEGSDHYMCIYCGCYYA